MPAAPSPRPRRREHERDGAARFAAGAGWLAGGAAAIAVGVTIVTSMTGGGQSPKPAPAPVPAATTGITAASTVLTRVEVILDAATPGLAASAEQKLTAAKLSYVGSVADDPLGQYAVSRVLVLTKDPAAETLGRKAAAALGIAQTEVYFTDQPTAVADVLVVLAADYVP